MFQIFRASGHDLTIASLERSVRFSDYRKVVEMDILTRGLSMWETERLGNICERLLFRLNSRTKGLLEVPTTHHKENLPSSIKIPEDEGAESGLEEQARQSLSQDDLSSNLDMTKDAEYELDPSRAVPCLKRKRHILHTELQSSISEHKRRSTHSANVKPSNTSNTYQRVNPEQLREAWASQSSQPQLEGSELNFLVEDLPIQPHFGYENMGISYLHRTARDYLEDQNAWASLLVHTSVTGFNPYTALLMGSIIEVKTTNFLDAHAIGARNLSYYRTLRPEEFYELSSSKAHAALIKDLDRALSSQWDFVGFPTL